MKIVKNMGEADRLVRMVVAIGLIGLTLVGAVHGAVAVFAVVVGVVFLATSAVSYCPLYGLGGVNSAHRQRTG